MIIRLHEVPHVDIPEKTRSPDYPTVDSNQRAPGAREDNFPYGPGNAESPESNMSQSGLCGAPAFADVSRRWDVDSCRWTYWLSDGRPLPSGYYIVSRPADAKVGGVGNALFRGPFDAPEMASTVLRNLRERQKEAATQARIGLWRAEESVNHSPDGYCR